MDKEVTLGKALLFPICETLDPLIQTHTAADIDHEIRSRQHRKIDLAMVFDLSEFHK